MEYPVAVVAKGPISSVEIESIEWPPLPLRIEGLCYEIWAEETRANHNLLPGDVLAARSARVRDGFVTIEAGKSLYPRVMGTTSHISVAEYAQRFIGVMGVTISADDCLVFGRRSDQIDWPDLWHAVAAGRLRPSEGTPLECLAGEYKSELGHTAQEILSLRWVALLGDLTHRRQNFEAVALVRSKLTVDQIKQCAQKAKSATEHKELIAIPWVPAAVAKALANPNLWVPTGWAGIALAAEYQFGVDKSAFHWSPCSRTYAQHMALARAG